MVHSTGEPLARVLLHRVGVERNAQAGRVGDRQHPVLVEAPRLCHQRVDGGGDRGAGIVGRPDVESRFRQGAREVLGSNVRREGE